MNLVNDEQTFARYFVYRSFNNGFDIEIQGINGTFLDPEAICQFITNPPKHDLKPIEEEIIDQYPNIEHDEFYLVYATLFYHSGEYGDYGECHCKPYFQISEVVEVLLQDIDFEMEDTDPTESPSIEDAAAV